MSSSGCLKQELDAEKLSEGRIETVEEATEQWARVPC
jgi:hypothetical protein